MARRPWLIFLLVAGLLCGAAPVLPGCALARGPSTNPRHPLVVATAALSEAVFALDDGEQALYTAGLLDRDPALNTRAHQRFSHAMVPVLEMGRQVEQAIAAWQPGQPAPLVLKQMLPALKGLVTTAVEALPGEPKARTLLLVTQVYDATAVVLTLMIGG